MTVYAAPGTAGALIHFKPRYEHCIGGEWRSWSAAPTSRTSRRSTASRSPRSPAAAEDIDAALDAAHGAAPAWGKSTAQRAAILNAIADRIDANLELLAVAETWDNGKSIRETLDADLPLASDHFRTSRASSGHRRAALPSSTRTPSRTTSTSRSAWSARSSRGTSRSSWRRGSSPRRSQRATCVVLKPAEQTPVSILVLIELIADLLPAGVVNVVNGFGVEAGKPLASEPHPQDRVHRRDHDGPADHAVRSARTSSRSTLELGGKSPNIFFESVADRRDAFYDKALEGFTLFAFNQGEVCTCPSRALIQSIYDTFLDDAIERTKPARQGNPLDTATQVGAQASNDQLEKILSYIDIGKQEGAKAATRRRARRPRRRPQPGATTCSRPIFEGNNRCGSSRRRSSARSSP